MGDSDFSEVPAIVPDNFILPEITIIGGDETIEIGTLYIDKGATALDDIDLDLTQNINVTNLVDTNLIGTYTVAYNVQDSSQNSAIAVIRTITVVDTTNPTDNTGTGLLFGGSDLSGNNVEISWAAFSDLGNIVNHKLFIYTDSSCLLGEIDFGFTGNNLTMNNSIVSGLSDGTYYGKVEGHDESGNFTRSSCSVNSILIDLIPPVITSGNFIINENLIAVGTVTATDLNPAMLIYSISGSDASSFTINANTGVLSFNSAPNFETPIDTGANNVYDFSAIVSDSYSSSSLPFTITILDVPDSPTVETVSPNAGTYLGGTSITITGTNFYAGDTVAIGANNCLSIVINSSTSITCSTPADTLGIVSLSVTASDGQVGSLGSAYTFNDLTAPTDNGANLQFINDYSATGTTVAVSWNAFTDTDLSYHKIYTYTDNGCITGIIDHGSTASSTSSNNSIVTSLTEGTYYAKVEAIDQQTNSTLSSCSTDFITVDLTSPTDNTGTALSFTNNTNNTGNSVVITWNAFTDSVGGTDHRIYTYNDSSCVAGAIDHGLTGSNVSFNSTIVTSLADGTYYAKVQGYDGAGNSTISGCSLDSIIIDKSPPTDNSADLQFTNISNATGNNIDVSWTAFSDINLSDHTLFTYTNSVCSSGADDHGLTSNIVNTNNVIISGLADGTYYGKVQAHDIAGNITTSACSTDTIIVDTSPPADNTADLQFSNAASTTGNNIAVSWTAFSDINLSDHTLLTYIDSSCATGETDHGLTSNISNTNNLIIDGLVDGTYYGKVQAHDVVGNITLSACSTDAILVDTTPPTDNTANLQFANTYNMTGDNIAVSWVAFSDSNLSDHTLFTFTDSACSGGVIDYGATGNNGNSNNIIIDGLADGMYYGIVQAHDLAGNITSSACSTDTIMVDTTPPTDNTANLQFTNATSTTGNSIAVSWTAFSDINLSDHTLFTYINSVCSIGAADHGLTSSIANTNNVIINGLADGTYYGKVHGHDLAGNITTSACSTDTIIVDSSAPTDNTADLQFTNATSMTGNNIAVSWSAFTDVNLSDHTLYTYIDSSCATGVTDHGLTSNTSNSNSLIIDGLVDGTYYGKVQAHDTIGNTTLSACSTDAILVDTTPPTDNTANLQFTNTYNMTGDNIVVSWVAFGDSNLSNYSLFTYTDSACSSGSINHGLTGDLTITNSTIIDSLADGTYYGKVQAHDLASNTTLSICSTDTIIVDTTSPIDNTADLQFTNAASATGNAIDVSWTAFTDVNLSDHTLFTYIDSSCVSGETNHGLTSNTSNTNNLIINGLTDGTYYGIVQAHDAVGNITLSACSTDAILVDTTPPSDNTANLQFTNTYSMTGNNIDVSWTAFSDSNLSDHTLFTYTDTACTVGEINYGLTSSNGSINNVIIDGLADGTYYGKVQAHDIAGNITSSVCSSDTIIVDTTSPTDNTANLQFTNDYSVTGNNIVVSWTVFNDSNLSNYSLFTYTDSGCSTGSTNHGLTGDLTITNNTIIDSLADGTYYGKVQAHDLAGNTTLSACSTDTIIVDTTSPTDNTANLLFSDLADIDGNDVAVTWVAFADTNLVNHHIRLFTDSGCSSGESIFITNSATNSNNIDVDGLTLGTTYWAKVDAIDLAGNVTTSACSTDSIFIGVDVAAKVVFVTGPTTTMSTNVITPAITVEIRDQYNHLVNSTATVDLSMNTDPSASTATISGTLTVAAVAGVATFSDINIDKAFTGYDLSATSSTLTSDTSGAFNITSGIAAKVGFKIQPSNAVVSIPIYPAMLLEIQDINGNLVNSSANITLSIITDPSAGAILGGAVTIAAVAGTATFLDITLDQIASGYILDGVSTGLTAIQSDPFEITNGAAVSLSVSPVSHDYGQTNSNISQTFILQNDGSVASGLFSVASVTGARYLIITDNCNAMILSPSEACTINVEFDAISPGTDQSYPGSLSITASPGGTLNVNLSAEKVP